MVAYGTWSTLAHSHPWSLVTASEQIYTTREQLLLMVASDHHLAFGRYWVEPLTGGLYLIDGQS